MRQQTWTQRQIEPEEMWDAWKTRQFALMHDLSVAYAANDVNVDTNIESGS